MRVMRLLLAMVGLVIACVGPYSERPAPQAAPEEAPREPEPAAPAADSAAAPAGEALVGHVTPDGRFHADTGAAAAVPARVERQTVVTGTVRASPAEDPAAEDLPGADTPPAMDPAERTPAAGAGLAAGYRVQVFAAQDSAAASEVARRLEGRLEGQPVYVQREDGWYKIRVGDFPTREAAEPLRSRLAGMGFTGAWTVPTSARAPR